MNAAEYFENQNTTTSTGSTNGTLPKRNPYNMTDSSWTESVPQNYHSRALRERYRRAGMMTPAGSIRYCSDPLKNGRDMMGEPSAPPESYDPSKIRVDLPVDEDDYLMPCPQNNQNASTYLDLVGDTKAQGQFISEQSKLNISHSNVKGSKTNSIWLIYRSWPNGPAKWCLWAMRPKETLPRPNR